MRPDRPPSAWRDRGDHEVNVPPVMSVGRSSVRAMTVLGGKAVTLVNLADGYSLRLFRKSIAVTK